MATITVKELQALGASDHGKRISLGDSMYGTVRVDRNGVVSMYTYWRYKAAGKVHQVPLGTWKDGKDGMSLKALREERTRLATELKNGVDPIERNALERAQRDAHLEVELLKIEAERQEAVQTQQDRLNAIAEQQARLKVRDLFQLWKQHDLRGRVDKGQEVERAFEKDVFPVVGDMAAADVTKTHVQAILDTIQARATERRPCVRLAKRTLTELRQMFSYGIDRELVEIDPTARLKKAKLGKDVERDRVLSEHEITLLFQRLPDAGMAETSEIALLLQLATITRIGEVLSARWEHVDLDNHRWMLPDTKNGKRHDIWLSDFAITQLQRLRQLTGASPWLFPASRVKKNAAPDAEGHVCVRTAAKQVADRQRGDAVPMSGRSKNTTSLMLPEGRWTPHDLRRTGATLMAEAGILPDVVERCLNHTEEKKVKRIYQRAKYEGPMRDAWELLGGKLTALNAKQSNKPRSSQL